MSSGLTGTETYSQPHSLTFDDVGLDYGADTQGIPDYSFEDFTLPSQTQSSQSQASQQQPQPSLGEFILLWLGYGQHCSMQWREGGEDIPRGGTNAFPDPTGAPGGVDHLD